MDMEMDTEILDPMVDRGIWTADRFDLSGLVCPYRKFGIGD